MDAYQQHAARLFAETCRVLEEVRFCWFQSVLDYVELHWFDGKYWACVNTGSRILNLDDDAEERIMTRSFTRLVPIRRTQPVAWSTLPRGPSLTFTLKVDDEALQRFNKTLAKAREQVGKVAAAAAIKKKRGKRPRGKPEHMR